jgi:uncharacterized protein (TIRG00374 family)
VHPSGLPNLGGVLPAGSTVRGRGVLECCLIGVNLSGGSTDLMKQKAIYPLIKLAVVSLALFWLSRRVDSAGVWKVLLGAKVGFLTLAAVFSLVPVFVSGFRWKTLLATLGIELPVLRLALICQIGQFFGVLVPGVAGDDGTRLLYISRLARGRVSQACSTVLLDRVIGFCCLFALSLVCIPLNWTLLSAQSSTKAVAVGVLAVGSAVLVGCAFLFGLSGSQLERAVGFVRRRFPASHVVKEWAVAADIFARNRTALLGVAVAALCTQILICATYWTVGAAVGIDAPLLVWTSFVPVIVLAGVLPITFAGIGVRDYLLFLYLGSHEDGGGDRLAALSLLLLGYTLFSALLGGAAYLFYKVAPPSQEYPLPAVAAKS